MAQILNDNIDKLHIMAEARVKYETIGADQIQDIMAGRDIREPASWRNAKDSNGNFKHRTEDKADKLEDKQQRLKLDGENEGTAPADGTTSIN
jgi:cell division protease FtsH